MSILNKNIEVGAAVQLASGGFNMTVVAVDGENLSVIWHGQRGELQREIVPVSAIRRVGVAGVVHQAIDASGIHG